MAVNNSDRGFPYWLTRRGTALFTGAAVLLLAVGALLFPAHRPLGAKSVLLVLDPSRMQARETDVYQPLGRFISSIDRGDIAVDVVRDLAAFRQVLAAGPDFLLCPDGVGLQAMDQGYLPLVVGRRAAPRNLRPRSVLVYRKRAGLVPEPWLSRPAATIIGDSLSLVATGPWCRHHPLAPPRRGGDDGPAFGPDPYDHAPALHALRLGCFDYAVVRQWDADRFLAGGLLPAREWGEKVMSPPAPDMMLLISGKVSARRRLALGDHLSALGRNPEAEGPLARALVAGLGRFHLAGFNLLLEPDVDLVRRNFPGHWPPTGP